MKENISNIEKKLRRFEKKHDININWDKIEMKIIEKQTAVEWLESQMEILLMDGYHFNSNEANELYEQAKETEKKQIIEAREDGYKSTYNTCESGCMGRMIIEGSHEQYYNETYEL